MEMLDGRIDNFAIHVRRGAAIVFGITDDEKVLLLEEKFISTQEKHKTLVAGGLDKNKTPEEVAWKELREEAGCDAEEMILLGTSVENKWTTGKLYFFLAKGVQLVGDQILEKNEDINFSFVSKKEFKKFLEGGEIDDATVEVCAWKALNYLEKN